VYFIYIGVGDSHRKAPPGDCEELMDFIRFTERLFIRNKALLVIKSLLFS